MFTLLFRFLHEVEALATGLNASRGRPADAEGGGDRGNWGRHTCGEGPVLRWLSL